MAGRVDVSVRCLGQQASPAGQALSELVGTMEFMGKSPL